MLLSLFGEVQEGGRTHFSGIAGHSGVLVGARLMVRSGSASGTPSSVLFTSGGAVSREEKEGRPKALMSESGE